VNRRRKGTVLYTRHIVTQGPLSGEVISLSRNGDNLTLPLVIRGQAGRYRGGHWEPAK
jgi:hypothetical protein